MNTATPNHVFATHAIASLALLVCASAHAQSVRKCNVAGRVVFQSSPCAAESQVVAPAAPPAVAVEVPLAPKKRTLTEVLRERDGANRGRLQAPEIQGDGATVLRARMGAV